MTKKTHFIRSALAALLALAAVFTARAQNEAYNNENVYALHFTVTHLQGSNGCNLSYQHAVTSVKARFRCRDHNFSCWENTFPFNENDTKEGNTWSFSQKVSLHYYCDAYPSYEQEANSYGLDHYDLEFIVYAQKGDYTVITDSPYPVESSSGSGNRSFTIKMPAHEVLDKGFSFVVGCETVSVRMEPLCKPYIESMDVQFKGYPYSYTVSAKTDCPDGSNYTATDNTYLWTYTYPGLADPVYVATPTKDFTLSLSKYPDLPLGENIIIRLLNGEESNSRNTRVVCFYPQLPQPTQTGDQIIAVGGRWDKLILKFNRNFNAELEEKITKITVYNQVGEINEQGFGESTPVFQYSCNITSLSDDLIYTFKIPDYYSFGPGRYYVTAEGSAKGKNNHPDNNTQYGSEIMTAMFQVTAFNVRTNELDINSVTFTEPDCPNGYGKVQISIASGGKAISTPSFFGLKQEEGLSVFREFSFSKVTGTGIAANTYCYNKVEEDWNTFIAVTDGSIDDAILAYAPSTSRVALQPALGNNHTLNSAELSTLTPTSGAKVGYFTVNYTSPEEMNLPVSKHNVTGQYAVNGTLYSSDDGYIEIKRSEMTGGTPPYTFYTYTPDKSPLTQDVLNLPVGNYSVEVYDSRGCGWMKAVNIKNAGNKLKVKAEIEQEILCYGGSGTLKAVLEDASSNSIIIQWYRDGEKVEGGRQAMLYYAVPGSYRVEATCLETGLISSDEIVLSQPDSLYIFDNYVQDVTCFGAKTGIIRVQARGGVSPYTFTWDDFVSGSERFGLASGDYNLTVIDSKGCNVRAYYTVKQPETPVVIIVDSIINAYYDADDLWKPGRVLAHAEGGTPNYMDIWAENADIDNLSPGTYRLVTWDYYHCQSYQTTTVGQMPPMQIELVQDSRNLCFGSANASCHVEVEGGIPPYHIKWSNGSTDSYLQHLGEGTYSVAVTDRVGAFRIAEIQITQPPLLNITRKWVQNPGYGGCRGDDCESDRYNGVIEVALSGGTPPYSCEWRKDGIVLSGEVSPRLEGLGGGTYLLTVTDANNCRAQFSETLLYTPVLSTRITVEREVLCHGASTGRLSAEASGGHSPYTYKWYAIPEPEYRARYDWDSWENTVGESAVLDNVPALWYGLKVTDSFGISSMRFIQLTQRDAVEIMLDSLSDPSYTGAVNGTVSEPAPDGYLSCRLQGGTLPYSWYWEKAGEAGSRYSGSLVRDDLSAGTYTLYAEDSAGCSTNETYTLSFTEPLVCFLEITDSVSCYGFADGSATGSVGGGKPPYRYTWITGADGAESELPTDGPYIRKTGLSTGSYTLRIEDSQGIETSFEIVLPEPDSLILIPDYGVSPCYGDSSGFVRAEALGGSSPYVFFFNGEAYTDSFPQGLENVHMEVSAVDRHGCRADTSVVLKVPEKLRLEGRAQNPDYAGSQWRNKAEEPLTGTIETQTSGGTGPYSFSWNTGDTTASLSGLDTGHYVLTVRDMHGCEAETSFELSRIKALHVGLTQTRPVSCYGFSDAALKAVAEGGVPPYRYQWFKDDVWFVNVSDGDSATALSLGAGVYKIYVSDANGIISRDSIVVTQPEPLRLRGTVTDATAWSLCNGKICTEAEGGTAPYSFLWSSRQKLPQRIDSACLSEAGRGNYVLQIKDSMGCELSPDFTVSSPDSLYIASSVVQNTKEEPASGSVHLRVKGGLQPYYLLWKNDDGGEIYKDTVRDNLAEISGLSSGTYSLYLKDSGGAEVRALYTVEKIDRLSTALLVLGEPSCPGGNNAAIQSFVYGGVEPYRREWQRWMDGRRGFETLPDTGAVLSDIPAGQYRFFAYDAWDDTVCAMTYIYDPAPMKAYSRMLHHGRKALDLPDVEVIVLTENGKTPYEYIWNDSTLSGNSAWLYSNRHYEVVIRDALGCEIFYDFDTLMSENMEIALTQVSQVLCKDARTAAVQLHIKYGRAPYSILWSNGDSSLLNSQLGAGTYSVTVLDAMGTSRTEEIEISEPAPLQIQARVIHPSCFGYSDGSISLETQGGTGFLQTYWNTRNEGRTIEGLREGEYRVTVSDQNQCVLYDTFLLKAPQRLHAQTVTDSIECPDGNGRIRYGVEGGTAPYRYFGSYYSDSLSAITQIAGGADNLLEKPVIEPARAGFHRFTVRDSQQCEWDTVLQLVSPPYPEYGLDSVRYLCQGQDISFGITPVRHLEQADYVWTYPDGSRSFDSVITTCQAGSHRLLIVRDGKCLFRDSVRVDAFSDSIEAEFWVSSRIFSGENCLLVNLSQYQPDSIVWTFPEDVEVLAMEGNYAEVSFPSAGLYTLIMTSYKGLCSQQLVKTVVVSEPKGGGEIEFAGLHDVSVWKVYPNPSRRECTLSIQSGSRLKVTYRIVSAVSGICVEQGSFETDGSGIFKKNLFNDAVPAGLYLLMVEYGQVKRGFKIIRL